MLVATCVSWRGAKSRREEDTARQRPWQWSFLEHFDEASVSASKTRGHGGQVAISGRISRPALLAAPAGHPARR